MGNNNFQQSDFFLQTAWQNEEYVAEQIAHVRKYLDSKGVDLSAKNYKREAKYIEIKDKRLDGFPGGAMSLEEFIDRFMCNTYKEVFSIGSATA